MKGKVGSRNPRGAKLRHKLHNQTTPLGRIVRALNRERGLANRFRQRQRGSWPCVRQRKSCARDTGSRLGPGCRSKTLDPHRNSLCCSWETSTAYIQTRRIRLGQQRIEPGVELHLERIQRLSEKQDVLRRLRVERRRNNLL